MKNEIKVLAKDIMNGGGEIVSKSGLRSGKGKEGRGEGKAKANMFGGIRYLKDKIR